MFVGGTCKVLRSSRDQPFLVNIVSHSSEKQSCFLQLYLCNVMLLWIIRFQIFLTQLFLLMSFFIFVLPMYYCVKSFQVFNVSDIYRHDEFRNQENRFSLFNHDIAVLRLDHPAVIGDYVSVTSQSRHHANCNNCLT